MDANIGLLVVLLLGTIFEGYEIFLQQRKIQALRADRNELRTVFDNQRTKLLTANDALEIKNQELITRAATAEQAAVTLAGQRDANLFLANQATEARHKADEISANTRKFLEQVMARPAEAGFTEPQLRALADHLAEAVNARIRVMQTPTRGASGVN